MKYRHGFHAGNFADVFKHVIVLELLGALRRKESAFFALDTHAGRGAYDLPSPDAARRPEYCDGIARLFAAAPEHPALRQYLELLASLGAAPDLAGRVHSYPGSPLIIASRLRTQDRAALFEVNASEAGALKRVLRGHRNVSVHAADGYAALRSHLPPLERRGLVLVDPPYESPKEERARLLTALVEGWRRWSTGMFAIWYPIKRRAPIDRFHAQLKASGVRRILCAELGLYPQDSRVSMNGCGMILVNPPFQLERSLSAALPMLHAALGGRPRSRSECFWLVPE